MELIWSSDGIKVKYLSVQQIKQLVDSLKDGITPRMVSRYMIITAILTGMRLGEIMALNWDDLNVNFKTIRINKSYDYVNGGEIKAPKTESSNRTIRINQGLVDLLLELKANNQDMIFKTKVGTIPDHRQLTKPSRSILPVVALNAIIFTSIVCATLTLLCYWTKVSTYLLLASD